MDRNRALGGRGGLVGYSGCRHPGRCRAPGADDNGDGNGNTDGDGGNGDDNGDDGGGDDNDGGGDEDAAPRVCTASGNSRVEAFLSYQFSCSALLASCSTNGDRWTCTSVPLD